LQELLQVSRDPDDGWVADAPEILTFARLALAANEATRRDCPLWVVSAFSRSSPSSTSTPNRAAPSGARRVCRFFSRSRAS
jgi:hypothetical protein